jgi:hypothetical protein
MPVMAIDSMSTTPTDNQKRDNLGAAIRASFKGTMHIGLCRAANSKFCNPALAIDNVEQPFGELNGLE